MKKVLFTLAIALGLTQTTQAQINYCDSTQQIEIYISDNDILNQISLIFYN